MKKQDLIQLLTISVVLFGLAIIIAGLVVVLGYVTGDQSSKDDGSLVIFIFLPIWAAFFTLVVADKRKKASTNKKK